MRKMKKYEKQKQAIEKLNTLILDEKNRRHLWETPEQREIRENREYCKRHNYENPAAPTHDTYGTRRTTRTYPTTPQHITKTTPEIRVRAILPDAENRFVEIPEKQWQIEIGISQIQPGQINTRETIILTDGEKYEAFETTTCGETDAGGEKLLHYRGKRKGVKRRIERIKPQDMTEEQATIALRTGAKLYKLV